MNMSSEQNVMPLRQLQLTEIELLKKFLLFCEENHLQYFALGGTMLGAVRHKGFIPWDDDIDIGLPRGDYDRFLKLCQEKPVPFEIHNSFSDSKYFRYPSRIEDASIKVLRTYAETPELSSAWVDIFPLDGMPSNFFVRFIWKYYILWRRAAFKFSCFSKGVSLKRKKRPLIEKILVEIGQIFPVEKIFNYQKEFRKIDKALKKFPYQESQYLFLAMGGYKLKELFPKRVFGEGAFYEYEGLQLRGPKDYETYLTQIYGNYMELPHETERETWHSTEMVFKNQDRRNKG